MHCHTNLVTQNEIFSIIQTVSESEQDYMSLIANQEIIKREVDDGFPVSNLKYCFPDIRINSCFSFSKIT